MIMIHSDNHGLVLPPRVAQHQFVIVPIIYKEDSEEEFNHKAQELAKVLRLAGMRVFVDDRETHNPGFKFHDSELKGIPVRIELGKQDMKKQEVRVVVRHDGRKF